MFQKHQQHDWMTDWVQRFCWHWSHENINTGYTYSLCTDSVGALIQELSNAKTTLNASVIWILELGWLWMTRKGEDTNYWCWEAYILCIPWRLEPSPTPKNTHLYCVHSIPTMHHPRSMVQVQNVTEIWKQCCMECRVINFPPKLLSECQPCSLTKHCTVLYI